MIPTIKQLTCLRCGHKWFPRSTKPPRFCPNPKCNSPYWDKPRKDPADETSGFDKRTRGGSR